MAWLNYTIGKEKLAEILGVSLPAAKELMTSFLSEYYIGH